MTRRFFPSGSQILWRYRREVRPMTVVRDDPDGLVAWIAPGAPTVRNVTVDGRDIRDLPMDQRFRVPRTTARGTWLSPGTLKIAPTGVPWSVWVFWDDDGAHKDWYVNLEGVHQRDDAGIITRDHVLDVVVRPDFTTWRKDEDELAAAVEAGRFTPEQAVQFEDDARRGGEDRRRPRRSVLRRLGELAPGPFLARTQAPGPHHHHRPLITSP